MDVQDHFGRSVKFGWIGMSGMTIEEAFKGFCCCLCACVDFGGQVIEGMHGHIIDCSCQVQELACDLLEPVLLSWCHRFCVVN